MPTRKPSAPDPKEEMTDRRIAEYELSRRGIGSHQTPRDESRLFSWMTAGFEAFAAAEKINYPVAVVGNDIEKLFGGILSVPSTFVVNPEGGIVQRHVGLLRAEVTEQEVRSLAHLPTNAEVSVVKDLGQVLKGNAAYATEIPGISFEGLTASQKAEALKRLNTEMCTCGCGSTLAGCRIEDPSCATSLPLAKKLVAAIRAKK